jgi:O-antigen ligase
MSASDLEAAAPAAAIGPRARLLPIADGLVTAVAVSLPWSTSATSILVVLWLIALVPTLDFAMVRREVLSAAGGLPLLLWALGAVGMLWADADWSERIAGLSGFHKLLLVPLLLAQFRRSGQAKWVFVGFLTSTAVLLVVSWAYILVPDLRPPRRPPGVPVKDYIFQSAIFATSAFGLLALIAEPGRARARIGLALALAAFVADIFYVATARTTLVVLAVLLLLFGLRQFGWKGALGAAVAGSMLAGAAWASSPYLRWRVSQVIEEVRGFENANIVTPVGLRLEYWRRSSGFIAEAPILGHGTGTIPELFRRGTTAETDPQLPTDNPHNQVLTVMLQIGLLGTAALLAMWIAHLALFRERTLVAWFGLVVVVQNVVGSLFNSSLSDFSQGWLYVLGVGVAGGVVLHGTPRAAIEGKA